MPFTTQCVKHTDRISRDRRTTLFRLVSSCRDSYFRLEGRVEKRLREETLCDRPQTGLSAVFYILNAREKRGLTRAQTLKISDVCSFVRKI